LLASQKEIRWRELGRSREWHRNTWVLIFIWRSAGTCGHVCYSGCCPLQNEPGDQRRGEWVLYDKLCTVLLAVLRKMGTFMSGINHITAVSYVETAFVRLDIHSAWHHPTSFQACHYDMLILLGTLQTEELTPHASFIISGTKQIIVAAMQ
jgi:hypothetical protein